MNEEMKQQEQTTTCPHCGNKTPQVFKFEITSIEDVSLSDGSIDPIKIYYFLVQFYYKTLLIDKNREIPVRTRN